MHYNMHGPHPGLDWDKKSALAFFGPGGPPPPPLLYIYIYIYIYIYNPKSEKVGTVWKTQIKKESSDF